MFEQPLVKLSWLDKYKATKNGTTSKRYIFSRRAQNFYILWLHSQIFYYNWNWLTCCMHVRTPYFPWYKVFIWSLKNYYFLSFKCVLLFIKVTEGLQIFLLWPWRTFLPIQLTCFEEIFVTASWNSTSRFAILKYLYQNTLLSFQLHRAD